MESPQPALNPAELADVGDQLGKLLASQLFSNSRRKAKLLKYLTEASLQGRGGEISEYAIGLDVFDRPSSFDPRIDSTVRAEMSRLRTRLKEYYSGEGRSDRVLIEFGS